MVGEKRKIQIHVSISTTVKLREQDMKYRAGIAEPSFVTIVNKGKSSR